MDKRHRLRLTSDVRVGLRDESEIRAHLGYDVAAARERLHCDARRTNGLIKAVRATGNGRQKGATR